MECSVNTVVVHTAGPLTAGAAAIAHYPKLAAKVRRRPGLLDSQCHQRAFASALCCSRNDRSTSGPARERSTLKGKVRGARWGVITWRGSGDPPNFMALCVGEW